MTTKMFFGSAVLLPVLLLLFTMFATVAATGFPIPDNDWGDDEGDSTEGSGYVKHEVIGAQADDDKVPVANSGIGAVPVSKQGPAQKSALSSGRCGSQEFECHNGECIMKSQICNNVVDCADESDELNCPAHGLDLKTYPVDQTIDENRAVVIQCRNEGLPCVTVRVHWIREDGAPLPPGSTDVDGRLEMPNVQVHHSGNYVCEALGVPANTPGRRVISHLTVEKDPKTAHCNPETEFLCKNDGQCKPLGTSCNGISHCIDEFGVANCTTPGTTTATTNRNATTDQVKSLLKSVEMKLDKIDDLIESVQRMNDAFKNLTTVHEFLTQEVMKLQKKKTHIFHVVEEIAK